MIGSARLILVLMAMGPVDAPQPAVDVQASYREAAAKAGRDPDAHVRLALWCEAHGLEADRLKHLARAIMADPTHAAARALMGFVADGGTWRRPEEVAERVQADAKLAQALAEYNARRAKLPEAASAHAKLADWCDKHGLEAEARAHYTAVTRLDPSNDRAWKRLGYARHRGRWMTAEQVAAERAEAEAQKKADAAWLPRLKRWKQWLGEPKRKAEAERELAAIEDPRAVRAVWATFAQGSPASQQVAVQVLGQVRSPAASRALVVLAVFSPSAEVRRRSIETLTQRDGRDYVGMVIALLQKPIEYEVRRVGGPGSPGTLLIKGPQFDQRRLYAPPPEPRIALLPGDVIAPDEYGLPAIYRTQRNMAQPPQWMTQGEMARNIQADLAQAKAISRTIDAAVGPAAMQGGPWSSGPGGASIGSLLTSVLAPGRGVEQQALNAFKAWGPGLDGRGVALQPVTTTTTEYHLGQNMLEARRAAATAEQQLEADASNINARNAAIGTANDRLLAVLEPVTSQRFGADRDAWLGWWADQQGLSFRATAEPEKPTVTVEVPLSYQPRPIPPTSESSLTGMSIITHSCFAAGTPVRTLDGPRPIESIRVGDIVLTEDTIRGGLGFQPVVAVYHNPPAATLRVDLGDESIVATPIHRFWAAGRGWLMARELRPGDRLRRIDGLATVAAIRNESIQKVYNLEVARRGSFFVGDRGVLVHDNSLVEPTPEPFDAVPTLQARAVAAGQRGE